MHRPAKLHDLSTRAYDQMEGEEAVEVLVHSPVVEAMNGVL